MKRALQSLILWAGLLGAGLAGAQGYPTKPIRIIIGQGPGGVTDVSLRLMADELGKRLGQQVVVENRPGANALIAANAVKNAPADGYTLFGGNVTTFAPVYMANGIVAPKELSSVAAFAFGDYFVYTPADAGISTLAELAAYAKAHPGRLRFSAPNSSNNLMMALLAKRMGITYEYIPYKTTDESIMALLRGEAQVTINSASGFVPQVQAGKLRAIAALSPQRAPAMPDVPTGHEQNVPVELRFNVGLWGPPGLPSEVVAKLHAATAEAVRSPAVIERLRTFALVPNASTPEQQVALYEVEIRTAAEAAQIVGLKPQ